MTTPNRSVKVPSVLYRQGGAVVQEDGTIRLSISSDEPYKRFDWWNGEEYWEVLDHTGGGADLTRIVAGTALLYNHDRDVQLGKIQSPELSDGKCFVKATLSAADDVKDFRTRITEGILKDCSVGYEIDDQGEEIGEKDGLPIYRFGWTPFEASMVTIPADITVGVGRERDLEKPKGEPREIRIREKSSQERENNVDALTDESHKRENQPTNMETPEEKAAREAKEAKQRQRDEEESARERAAQVQEGIKLAREREKEIRAIAVKANDKLPKEELEKAIEAAASDERAVENFRKLVFEKYFGNPEPLETPAGDGGADIKVLGERGDGKRKLTAGERFVNAKGFKEFSEGTKKGEFRANVGGSILAERGLVTRAGFNSTDLGAVNVTISQEMISLGVQRLTIMDLLAGGVMTTAGFIYPVENSFDPFAEAALTVPERGLKPEWEPDITTARADAQVIAVMATVPKQFMADFGAFGSWLNSRGDYLLQIKAEQQILYGDGLGSNLLGITARPGIQARAYGSVVGETTADALFRGNTDIETNAYFDADGFAMHPYDFEQIRLLKDANGQYLGGGPFYAPYGTGTFIKYHTIWGLPCVVSKSVKQGKPIAGAWKMGAQWFLREGLQIETSTSHKDYFQRNLLAVLFEERMALAVYRPIAFLEHTGFPGRS